MIFEGNPLNLIEEHLRVIVPHDSVGADVRIAKVEHEETAIVMQREKPAGEE